MMKFINKLEYNVRKAHIYFFIILSLGQVFIPHTVLFQKVVYISSYYIFGLLMLLINMYVFNNIIKIQVRFFKTPIIIRFIISAFISFLMTIKFYSPIWFINKRK